MRCSAGVHGPGADGCGPSGRRGGDGVARVALVGFDQFALADKLTPPVTVVARDPAAIGHPRPSSA